MEQQTLWIVAALGAGTLIGVFWKMKGGFGPINLRVVGIVLIAVLASLLSLAKSNDLNAALGILGTIAGYLFGTKAKDKNDSPTGCSSVDTSGSQFGDNAKVAGRDINETVNNIQSQIKDLSELLGDSSQKIKTLIAQQTLQPNQNFEYLINSVFERGADKIYDALSRVIEAWSREGWLLIGVTQDYDRSDAMILIFSRPTTSSSRGNVQKYSGSRMDPAR